MRHFLNILFGIALTGVGVPLALAQATAEKEAEEPGLLEMIISKIPLYITALLVFLVFLVVAVIVKKSVESRLAAKIEEEHQEALIISGRLSFLAVVLIGTTIALSIAGIDLTALLAALAFGISFGLQDTIANFVAGLGILASRPFKLGDFININGKLGKVVEIRTRATYLRTIDGLRLIVPNAELYKSQVLSYTSNPTRRVKVPVYCRYGVNMEEVFKICINVAKKHKEVMLQPKPSVVFTDLADYYIELTLRFWVVTGTPWFILRSKIFGEIEQRLEEAGLEAPYPITSLSTEEDVEYGVLKTQPMTENEVKAWVTERNGMNEEFAKRREELLKDEPAAQAAAATVDTPGNAFMHNPNFPIASAVMKAAAAQPQPGAVQPQQVAQPQPVVEQPQPATTQSQQVAPAPEPAPAPVAPAPQQNPVPTQPQPAPEPAPATGPAPQQNPPPVNPV